MNVIYIPAAYVRVFCQSAWAKLRVGVAPGGSFKKYCPLLLGIFDDGNPMVPARSKLVILFRTLIQGPQNKHKSCLTRPYLEPSQVPEEKFDQLFP